jgi:ubiquinone/menaquinone biosynthesis C-methylase UbiE
VLRCIRCSTAYPIIEGIPDFIQEELAQSADPALRRMSSIDRKAHIYESKLWYPIVLNLYGGLGKASLSSLVTAMSRELQAIEGQVLDVACGPATFGRRIASPGRDVYGIDVSMEMLRQGATYLAEEGTPDVHLARARVEALPFEGGRFDAALCCGSLHLFADTVAALREIARALKPSAVLAVVTFTPGRAGLLRFGAVRERMMSRGGVRVFELPQIDGYLADAGFHAFAPTVSGSILTFSAMKRSS